MTENRRGPYKLVMSEDQRANRDELLSMLGLEDDDLGTVHIEERRTVSAHIGTDEWLELDHIAHLTGFRGVGPLNVAILRWFLGAYEPPRSSDRRRGVRKKQKPAPTNRKKKGR